MAISERDFLKVGGLFLLASVTACTPLKRVLTPTLEPATGTTPPVGTPTETSVPATPTPEATKAPEFKVCAPENFRDCPITVEQLFNGDYFNWLYTLSKPFDTSKIKNLPIIDFHPEVIYDIRHIPNFTVKGTEPFRRDVTAGYVQLTDEQGGLHEYAVMPIEYYDVNHPDQNQWVITVNAINYPGYQLSPSEQVGTIQLWRDTMNITPFLDNSYTPIDYKLDPLVSKTFELHPDMADRFKAFTNNNKWAEDVSKQDRSALSEPGIVLLNEIVKVTSGNSFYR